MADLDEAAINNPSTGGGHVDIDLSDETQDFRMLSNLSFLTDSSDLSLPKRGEKDFEPNPTLFQADILSASRQAMHNALAYPRLHHPKNIIVGVYAPNGPTPPTHQMLDKTSKEETEKPTPVSIGAQVHPESCVYVANPKGQHFKTLGHADRWGRVWLLPEEALYLLERGSMDIRWPRCAVGEGDEVDIEDSGLPMSLQAAYACLIGCGGLTMERFSVFTGLKRLGYTVIRAPGWAANADSDELGSGPSAQGDNGTSFKSKAPGLVGIFTHFLNWLRDTAPTTAKGPVVGLGFYHSYENIYRKLSVIPFHDPVTAIPSRPELPYDVVWHVYKPSTAFRKSAPPNPDFKIAVVNARETTTMPTLSQIGTLLDSTPLDPPRPDRQLYVRLKNGYRNVILAVVDSGVVSYLRIADAAFGKEKVYGPRPFGGNKGRGPPRQKFKKR
ncbi:tRNA-splicing endonuclease subunit sen54 N-term-domain-containing protein [Aspergillus unguis]